MSKNDRQDYLRLLPSVERVLQEKILQESLAEFPRHLAADAVRDLLARKRMLILNAVAEELQGLKFSSAGLAKEALIAIVEQTLPHLRPVINATGVILHTNLGRSPLAPAAVQALKEIGESFSNLELSLKTGRRSSRYEHIESLLCYLTGAEAALVVNNNAGAVFLSLNSLAAGREVVVSRGELVEVGGSFRISEVMASSGARLIEVGATNKCYLKDYRRAVNGQTALLLKVHTSNYRIMGFTAAVPARLLVKLAAEYNIPCMEDLGSGVLVDLSRFGLPREPMVQESIGAGVDLVTFSGDKLLGGPQAGIIAGKKKYLDRIRENQLLRALRVDKFTLAALEATLRLYCDEAKAMRQIPVLRMLTISRDELLKRAERLSRLLAEQLAGCCQVTISHEHARVGGGALPLTAIPSMQVCLEPLLQNAGLLAAKLRRADPPVIVRVHKNKLLLDLRSVMERQDEMLVKAVLRALDAGGSPEEAGMEQ
ncbi:MAG TPA: L-seryl-tRNA(Sec) selenium transferase [Firmicutes bacterium]|nr:L-seryl-tRNA(Sec) selenium transferase [Bacillota bacterium]